MAELSIIRFPHTITIPFPFILTLLLLSKNRFPSITSVSLTIRLRDVPINDNGPCTVIYPLIVISQLLILVWGVFQTGFQVCISVGIGEQIVFDLWFKANTPIV